MACFKNSSFHVLHRLHELTERAKLEISHGAKDANKPPGFPYIFSREFLQKNRYFATANPGGGVDPRYVDVV